MPPFPTHLQPTAPLAERALLPGDPALALALAQALLAEPRMFNHSRGLWGYSGTAPDAAPLTIQSTGIGGPSAAVVLEELCDLGVRAVVHIGTCRALSPGVGPGEVVLAEEVLARDGVSRAMGVGRSVAPDAALAAALSAAADHAGLLASGDLYYDHAAERVDAAALAADMEAAAILAVARRRGVRAASVLAVSHAATAGRQRLEPGELTRVAERLGRAAVAALAPTPARPRDAPGPATPPADHREALAEGR